MWVLLNFTPNRLHMDKAKLKLTIYWGLFLIPIFVMAGCKKDERIEINAPITLSLFGKQGCTSPVSANYDREAVNDNGTCEPVKCSECTYVVENKFLHDGIELGLKPGDVICLDAKIKDYKNIKFINLEGTKEDPIIIINCDGVVTMQLDGTSPAVIRTEFCEHFRITGLGDPTEKYGIKLGGARGQGIKVDRLSTNFEIDHIEISDIGFAGIMAKTDPTCDDATIRENFTMFDVSLHDNFIHDIGGEGFYVGNSFYEKGQNKECGKRFPHAIHGIKIFNNRIMNSGWEGLQLGAATKGAEVYNNYIENFGQANKANQRNGLQIGEGTGGLCYNNVVISGNGNGLNVLGYGDNLIFNNIIVNPGLNGIFCDERFTPDVPGNGFKFINNTIINPGKDGIRLFAEQVELNKIINNVIINPATFDDYENDKTARDGFDSYIYLLNSSVNLEESNNYLTRDITEVKFMNPAGNDYSLLSGSPLINSGKDVSEYEITFDLFGTKRPTGEGVDIGAIESPTN